ncbi:hypothetical protein [Geoglobus acetivorans]|uniref:Uncharacterized protein n=1 Tax=Geoglobus acetivorans TaxID=565033 RepID=A0ABZ3H6M2_GEOAI|nr:hypothetical protein [Geoglobus acetivorans]
MTASDYEILVSRMVEKGVTDPERIAGKLDLPESIVRAALERAEETSENIGKSGNKIEFNKETFKLAIDVVLLYLVVQIIFVLAGWFL